ncbi:MAG: ATP-binding protein [Polyangiaceae bacterium]
MAWNEIRHRAHLVRHFESVPGIEGNENRLGQVFLNLLLNAAQAIPEPSTENNEIAVSIRPDGAAVVIEVADTGTGIEPTQQKRIFEPFYTTKHGTGTGIGLSICLSIVTELGGQLTVRSQLGKGTVFRVVLPAVTAPVSSIPPRVEPAATKRARILAIDDEAQLCRLIQRLLGPQHDVHVYTDAREAVALLRDENAPAFDVVFCDLMMPRMSGIDFYRELQRIAPPLKQRTVFLTGGAFNSQAREFLSGVTNRVIEKPFSAASLHSAIAHLLESDPTSATFPAHPSRAAI